MISRKIKSDDKPRTPPPSSDKIRGLCLISARVGDAPLDRLGCRPISPTATGSTGLSISMRVGFWFSSTIDQGHVQKMSNAWATKMTRIDSLPIATGKINLCRHSGGDDLSDNGVVTNCFANIGVRNTNLRICREIDIQMMVYVSTISIRMYRCHYLSNMRSLLLPLLTAEVII